MHVVVTGASGLIGRALTSELRKRGAAITGISRTPVGPRHDGITWVPWEGLPDAVSGSQAVIHLAGAGVADRRWTATRKEELRTSRIETSRQVVEAIQSAGEKPSVLISASAVGYYGDRGEEVLTEESSQGDGFLAQLCADWETATAGAGVRSATFRLGLVMSTDGGFLKPQILPFKLGLGGPIGRGTQYVPWIHVNDVVRMLLWATENNKVEGVFNACAPEPVPQKDFARAMGRALSRPAILPLPPAIFKLPLGEGASLMTMSTRTLPERAQELGFEFEQADLDAALSDLLA
jgi:uncharacterized protein (TIGR01777 family)